MARHDRTKRVLSAPSKESFDWNRMILVLNLILTMSLIYLHLR